MGAQEDRDLDRLWRAVRARLLDVLPEPTIRLWIDPLNPVAKRGDLLYLRGPQAVQAWVERRYGRPLREALAAVDPAIEDFAFGHEPEAEADPIDAGPNHASLPDDPLRNFERFVIGPGNRLAHAAALAVAESPGEAYNPLFIHGPPGLGKSHLLNAIATYMRRRHPALNIHHTTAERFTNEFVAALRKQGPARFKARYRELDALLIDDVQVLEGKPRTEEEFAHTFNALHAAGKQIVLSSDRPPSALSQIADRLRDRFSWGLCVAIDEPDRRTRMALLWRLAAGSSLEVPGPELLQRIAERAPANVRGLEGAMTRVIAHSSLLGQPVDEDLIDRALAGSPQRAPDPARGPGAPSIIEIQETVAAAAGLTRDDLLSKVRTKRISQPRQLAIYLSRELTGLPLTAVAKAFGRDHSTVIHSVRAVESRLDPGSETQRAIHTLRGQLMAGRGENRIEIETFDSAAPESTEADNAPDPHHEQNRDPDSTRLHTPDTSDPDRKMQGP